MKKFIKNLLVSLVLGSCIGSILLLPIQAANSVFSMPATVGTNVLITGADHVNSITIINTSTTNQLFKFFDSTNRTSVTVTNANFTNYTYSTSLITNLETNVFGLVTSNAYTVITRTTNSISGIYSYRVLAAMNVLASTSQTINFSVLQLNTSGLTVTNVLMGAGDVIINVDYSPRF